MEATMTVTDELLAANAAYSHVFTKGDLPIPPARQVAILVCMDARIDPARALGLEEGDAHVIRNAGGRASDDALRSLIISQQLLGTREVLVIHHTDCGMLAFTDEQLRQKLYDELGADASGIDFLAFDDLEQSVRDDVATIRSSPLILEATPVRGFVYDVHTGRLTEVV
jgi:carbonic anhydrase